ncbi:MAG: hypothetical protein JWQ47_612 [Glaciihabitans sp.]|nr:hypothetical protein [Glaciihabitans sp.]
MLKTKVIITVIVAAVALTGGAGVAVAVVSGGLAPVASTDTPTATATATSTPAADDTTPTPTATPWPYTEVADADATFLQAMHADGFLNGITIPADGELIADGHAACVQMAAGTSYDKVQVIEDDPHPFVNQYGASAQSNNATVGSIASQTFCTEYNIENTPVVLPTNPY